MDPKGKGMVVNDKEKESFVNDPKEDKPTDLGSSHKRKDGRKKKTRRIKEIVYYDSDKSSSSQKDDDNDYEKKKTVNSNFSFDYSRIPQSTNAHLLSIPLGKPPQSGIRIAPRPTPTTKDSPPPPSTSHSSSPTSITHASWQRRRRYVLETILLMLLQARMSLVMMMK
jgi:hypothetical protein